MARPILDFRGFGRNAVERIRVTQVFDELEKTEVGRAFVAGLPKHIVFTYHKGNESSRAGANPDYDQIDLPQNTFNSNFGKNETILHELAHLFQQTRSLDPHIKALLEGAVDLLSRHRNDKQYIYVGQPLNLIMNEETFAQDIMAAVLKLGYGITYRNPYYASSRTGVPASGRYKTNLTGAERALFIRLIDRIRVKELPLATLQNNLRAYEEFYRRALKVGWTSSTKEFDTRLQQLRANRMMH